MKTTKILTILLAVVLCLSVFAGCKKAEEKTPVDAPTQAPAEEATEAPADVEEPATSGIQEPTEPVEINFWHIFPEGDPTYTFFDEFVNAFNEKHENVTVAHMGISFWDYWTKIATSIAGNEGPDIAFNQIADCKSRINENLLANLSDYFAADEVNLDQYVQSQFDYIKGDDSNLYAFPYGTPARVLYYNKDMFEAAGLDPNTPPTNWEELEQYSEKLTTFTDDSKKQIDVMGFDPTMGNFLFWTLAWTNGGDFFDDDLNPTVNSPKNVEALEWMVKMHTKYGMDTMLAFDSQAKALQTDAFVAGKAAMEVNNEGLYAQIKQNAPDLNFGVATIPYQGENRVNWSSGFTLEMVKKEDKNQQDGAWLFFKELISTDGQIGFFEQTGWLMSDKAIFENESVNNDPVIKTLLEESEYARNIEYLEADIAWHVTIQPFIDAALLQENTPQAALDEAQAAIQDKIDIFNGN